MLSPSPEFKRRNEALSKWPVYVAEIFFANGSTGVDGTNDIYFSNVDVSEITGFPEPSRWFPFLKADSIGSMSQQVDPINGVSSIGSLNLAVTDYHGMVSDIIQAADAAGHGLRRQRISIYMLYRGMSWADRALRCTMQINDLRLTSNNEYRISCADVQRLTQKTVFNPAQTTLSGPLASSGAISVAVLDARKFNAGTSVSYGTSGFFKINGEIMRWDTRTDTAFSVSAVGRGMFGTTPTAHAQGDKVDEIFYLNENPITMALKIMESSGTAGAKGAHDAYPATWGCAMAAGIDVDQDGWLRIGELLTGLSPSHLASDGNQFEFVLDKGVEAKKFIEDNILKIIGAFGFVRGDGLYSIKAYSDLSNAAKENAVATLDRNAVVKWGDLTYNYNDLANQIWIEYDEFPKLSGKFVRNAIFVDSVSIKKWGAAKQLKYSAFGIMPNQFSATQLYQQFQRVGARYSRPPMQIPLTLLPRYGDLEIGDIVRVLLPIRDLFTRQPLDRAFEIIARQIQPRTGEVVVNCIAQPERSAFWFGGVGEVWTVVISPGAVNIPTGSTFQMVARSFDGIGLQIPTPAISWQATGNVTVDANGMVTAGAIGSGSVSAIVNDKVSNTTNFTITNAANTNPVASVVVLPSSVRLKAADTQQLTAVAYDINGAMVNGVTFNWASSNTGVATVPAGAGISKLLTAVANGTSNITATETVSGIASPNTGVTVATPETPTYTPPYLADSAYQVGTQITTMGPVGGPHVIPDGYNFDPGDYWFDGDVSLPANNTCHINYSVRIFSTGVITISGVVNGRGRGGYGGNQGTSGIHRQTWEIGFVGRGGESGCASSVGVQGYGLASQYASMPAITPSALAVNGTGQWTSVGGLPKYTAGVNLGLGGSGGGAGRWYSFGTVPPTEVPHIGARGGAGLFLMARGIYITSGLVDLRGDDGQPNDHGAVPGYIQGTAGGGGGGSFVALAERNVNGLPTSSISLSRIYVSGGLGGTSTSGLPVGQPGTSGGITTKVIG
ncbi:MAG TPA: hypothetical protein VK149_03530 [Sideroxyarcus sp.]|nr:hypothetical protein [Sideroxyarcus sp.]